MMNIIENMGYIWLAIAFAFLFAELGTPGLFFFISFAIGSFAAALAFFLGFSLTTQFVVAISITLISFFLMKNYLKKKSLSDVIYEASHTNIDALINKNGIVTQTIEPHKKGRVKVGGEEWLAESQERMSLQKGTVVKVNEVRGNRVIVQPEVKGSK